MEIRRYKKEDCEKIVNLFYETIYEINKQDYSKEQLDAWTYGADNLIRWDQILSSHFTVVAMIDQTIVGFGDIDKNGYLDHLFVHKNYQNQKIASSLCDILEQAYHPEKVYTYASITALPFFEKRGYQVKKTNLFERNNIKLANYLMEKVISNW